MSLQLNQPPFVADRETSRFYQQLYDFFRLVGTRTINIGNIVAGTVTTFTISVVGAKADMNQTVEIAAPSAVEAGLLWCGHVSADDTVTVRVANPTGGDINPASAEWAARVTR